MQKSLKIVYKGMMILLVMLTVITIWTDNAYNSTINFVVWLVFFTDFVIRLFITKEKWNFIKSNPFIIIATIPFIGIGIQGFALQWAFTKADNLFNAGKRILLKQVSLAFLASVPCQFSSGRFNFVNGAQAHER